MCVYQPKKQSKRTSLLIFPGWVATGLNRCFPESTRMVFFPYFGVNRDSGCMLPLIRQLKGQIWHHPASVLQCTVWPLQHACFSCHWLTRTLCTTVPWQHCWQKTMECLNVHPLFLCTGTASALFLISWIKQTCTRAQNTSSSSSSSNTHPVLSEVCTAEHQKGPFCCDTFGLSI